MNTLESAHTSLVVTNSLTSVNYIEIEFLNLIFIFEKHTTEIPKRTYLKRVAREKNNQNHHHNHHYYHHNHHYNNHHWIFFICKDGLQGVQGLI